MTIETTLYQENKTKYKSLLETISHTDDSTDEVAIQPTKDDIKLSIHNAEKETHIKEIYEKTVIISKISKDIKEIAHAQEKTIESRWSVHKIAPFMLHYQKYCPCIQYWYPG